jgi:hypothetical protein
MWAEYEQISYKMLQIDKNMLELTPFIPNVFILLKK